MTRESFNRRGLINDRSFSNGAGVRDCTESGRGYRGPGIRATGGRYQARAGAIDWPGGYPMRTPCGGAIRSLLMPGGFRFPIGQEGIRPHEKSGGSGPGRN